VLAAGRDPAAGQPPGLPAGRQRTRLPPPITSGGPGQRRAARRVIGLGSPSRVRSDPGPWRRPTPGATCWD